MTASAETIGDRVAEDFSANKVELTDAEKRRLAGMIDKEKARLEAANLQYRTDAPWRSGGWGTTARDLAKVTDGQLAEWSALSAVMEKHNSEVHARLTELWRTALGIAVQIWGEHHTLVKKFKKTPLPLKPRLDFDSFARQVQERRQELAAKELAKKHETDRAAMRDRAIAWLIGKGKVIGADFTADTAISIANDIAFAEEVERRKADGGFIYFDGQNCDGPCAGWDMESNRCECGNRRVCWTRGDGHSFESPELFAEAY